MPLSEEVTKHIADGGWCQRSIPSDNDVSDADIEDLRKELGEREYSLLMCPYSLEKIKKPVVYGRKLCDWNSISEDGINLRATFKIHPTMNKLMTEENVAVPDEFTLESIIEIYAKIRMLKEKKAEQPKEAVAEQPIVVPIAPSPIQRIELPARQEGNEEIDIYMLITLLQNEGELISALLDPKLHFSAEQLLDIAKTKPTMGLLILRESNRRSELTSEQLIKLASYCDTAYGRINYAIAQALFENYTRFKLNIADLAEVIKRYADNLYRDEQVTIGFLHATIDLLDAHARNKFLSNEAISVILSCKHISVYLCDQIDKQEHILFSLENRNVVDLLKAYQPIGYQPNWYRQSSCFAVLLAKPTICEAIRRLDGASLLALTEYDHDKALLRHILFNEELRKKMNESEMVVFLSRCDSEWLSANNFIQTTRDIIGGLHVNQIMPRHFYQYVKLLSTYLPGVDKTGIKFALMEMTNLIRTSNAICSMEINDIIELSKMDEALKEAICLAILKYESSRDETPEHKYIFTLPELDELIAKIETRNTSVERQFIDLIKRKLTREFVDVNFGLKSVCHAIATIEIFLGYQRVPITKQKTACLAIFNICKGQPAAVNYITTQYPALFDKFTSIFTDAQKKELNLPVVSASTPIPVPKPKPEPDIGPRSARVDAEDAQISRCLMM